MFFNQTFTQYVPMKVLDSNSAMTIYLDVLIEMAFILLPIMAIAMVAAVLGNFFQFGFLFTTEPLKFDLKKIDPIKGLKRIFSIRAIVELLKSLLKISFIGTVTFLIIWTSIHKVLGLAFKVDGTHYQS